MNFEWLHTNDHHSFSVSLEKRKKMKKSFYSNDNHKKIQKCTVSHTGKCKGLQVNPYNENRIPAMRTGFPVMKAGFSLWELTYREFSVSLTGFGFTVYKKSSEWKPALIAHPYFQAFHRLRIDIAVLTLLECLFLKRVVSSRRRRMFSGLFFWAYQMSVV